MSRWHEGRCIAALLLLAGLGLPLGCTQAPEPGPSPTVDVERQGDLALRLEVDRQQVRVGESLELTLTATNTGEQPMRIEATSGAEVIVTIWRRQWNDWIRVKEYPEAAIQVLSPWTLGAESERTFTRSIPVQPDWPVLEQMRLTTELNGRPDVRPEVMITVQPRQTPQP